MVIEWQVLAAIVAILSPLVIVIVTYVKTWATLQVTIVALKEVVEKLTTVVEGVKAEQGDIMQRIVKVETKVEELQKEVDRLK